MIETLTADLNKETPSEFHNTLLSEAKALVKMSRSKMSKSYDNWDLQDMVYRGERMPDEDDVRQSMKQNPVKMIVPNTFAQTMTFTSFLFLMFTQNKTFFELIPTGGEDYGTKQQDCETVLENNLRNNQWNTILFQSLLDTARFGLGVIDTSWTRKIVHAHVGTPQVATYQGVETDYNAGSQWQEFTKYEGNLVRSVSPYRFFPDTRFPLVDFQRGEFCAAEEEYSKADLCTLEEAGEVAGIKYISNMPNNWKADRGGETRTQMDFDSDGRFLVGPSKAESTVLVTKMQRWLVPSEYKFGPDDKQTLGPEKFKVLYHLWYANDNRVIRCEPAYWWHNEFSWSVGQFTPDMHHTLNQSLAGLIYRLQDVITWLINARITDVRRNLRGRHIVDPSGLEMSSLDGDGDIYLRKSAAKSDVRRWITQLDVKDVTQSHMQDAELISKIVEVVTGVNNNAMGQYNSGRRSAQESRTVTAGAAGRMKMHGQLLWDTNYGQVGKKMLSNNRQSLGMEMFARLVGQDDQIEQRYAAFKGTPEEVICSDDYMMFDSTLSSEKGFAAQSMQELLSVILQSDPTAAARMAQGIDPVKIVEQIEYLRGNGNIKRLRYTPEEQQQIVQAQQAREAAANQGKAPSSSMSYKDVPEDIKRQMEKAEGYQPSMLPPPKVEASNGNGSAAHLDRSTSITINKPNASK